MLGYKVAGGASQICCKGWCVLLQEISRNATQEKCVRERELWDASARVWVCVGCFLLYFPNPTQIFEFYIDRDDKKLTETRRTKFDKEILRTKFMDSLRRCCSVCFLLNNCFPFAFLLFNPRRELDKKFASFGKRFLSIRAERSRWSRLPRLIKRTNLTRNATLQTSVSSLSL